MFFVKKNNLSKYLDDFGLIKREDVKKAFEKVDRADFVHPEARDRAYHNTALPIGDGQTISQPQVVAFMLHLLEPKKGGNFLDIGFGSGWTTALLAEIIGNGKVIAIERIESIYEFGKNNINKYDYIERGVVELFCGDGREGKESHAPYDGILISASDKDAQLPLKIRDQLKDGGRIVMPIRDSLFLFTKKGSDFEMCEYEGYSFVPLV